MTAKTKPVAKATNFTSYGPGPRGKDHTAIVIDHGKEWVTYISIYDGMDMHLHVGKSHTQEFDQWYTPTKTYPVEKLAELYLQYALRLGGTEDALEILGKIINISERDKQMAVAKKSAADATKNTEKPAPKAKTAAAEKPAVKANDAPAKETKASAAKAKPAAEKPAAKAKPAAEKPAAKAKETKTPATNDTSAKKPSAAQRFQDLIMEGKKTDDEIFAVVQKEFGLDDSKRGYVKWYRNNLKKQGKNPPEAKSK